MAAYLMRVKEERHASRPKVSVSILVALKGQSTFKTIEFFEGLRVCLSLSIFLLYLFTERQKYENPSIKICNSYHQLYQMVVSKNLSLS